MINKQRLSIALATIHKDESDRYYSSGKFLHLLSAVQVKIAMGADLGALLGVLSYIHQDVWNIETIARRLNWQTRLIAKGKLDELLGAKFTECDIDLFHVQYRSLFDYLAKFIVLMSEAPGQVPRESFERLYNWVGKSEENIQKIGAGLAKVVRSCDWFTDLREVRNSIVHSSGRTIVFPEKNRILFQVEEGFKNKIHVPEVMFNANIVDFELYAGLFIGYLIAYLEEIAVVALRRLNLERTAGNMKSYHGGLPVVKRWIERVNKLPET